VFDVKTLFTLWDLCSTLGSIFLIGGIPHLCQWFSLLVIAQRVSSCTIPSGACERHTWLCVHSIFHLSPSKYLAFCCSSCWMMGDALIPSFQRSLPIELWLIFSGIRSRVFLVPWGLQSSVAGSLTIDSGNTSMSLDR
jgi:hypothetical protein